MYVNIHAPSLLLPHPCKVDLNELSTWGSSHTDLSLWSITTPGDHNLNKHELIYTLTQVSVFIFAKWIWKICGLSFFIYLLLLPSIYYSYLPSGTMVLKFKSTCPDLDASNKFQLFWPNWSLKRKSLKLPIISIILHVLPLTVVKKVLQNICVTNINEFCVKNINNPDCFRSRLHYYTK